MIFSEWLLSLSVRFLWFIFVVACIRTSLFRLFSKSGGDCVTKSCLTLLQPTGLLHLRFPRQEYWSVLPFLFPENLPNAGIKAASTALAGGFFTTEIPGKTFPEAIPFYILTSSV